MTRKSPRWVKINFKTETRISKGKPFGHTATLPVNCNKLNSVCTPRIARFVIGTSIVWQIPLLRGGGVSRISLLFFMMTPDESRQLPRAYWLRILIANATSAFACIGACDVSPTPDTTDCLESSAMSSEQDKRAGV